MDVPVIAPYKHIHNNKPDTCRNTFKSTALTHKGIYQMLVALFSSKNASLYTSWFQHFSFIPTIPNLKNPSQHFRQSTFTLALNNTLYHTLSASTQPMHAYSASPFANPLHW